MLMCWPWNGQFGKLRDWWSKLLSWVCRTELNELEFTKMSSVIWSAANWAAKIGSAVLLFNSHPHASTALKMLNRFTNYKVKKY